MRNRDKNTASNNNWRAKYFYDRNDKFAADEWETLCEAYNNRCLACGEVKPLTADHIIPLYKGGSNTIDNIQPLCFSCNSTKHTKCIDYRSGNTIIVLPETHGIPKIKPIDKPIGLRLDATDDERDIIRKAAALAGYRSMAEFAHDTVLRAAQTVLDTAGISTDNQPLAKKEGKQ